MKGQFRANQDLEDKALKASVARYESWLEGVKDAVVKLGIILVEEGRVEFNAAGQRISLQDITKVVNTASQLLPELKNALWEKQLENNALQTELNKLKNPVREDQNDLSLKVAELKLGLEKASKDKYILETRLESKKTECEAMYEKGTPHRHYLGRKDGLEAAKFNYSQGREQRANQKEDIMIIIEAYKRDIEGYKATIEELFAQKNELELHNKKANEEILALVGRLKTEQEKQKQLSYDLEILREEMKAHRLSEYDY